MLHKSHCCIHILIVFRISQLGRDKVMEIEVKINEDHDMKELQEGDAMIKGQIHYVILYYYLVII